MVDPTELAERLLKPRRARLVEAVACVLQRAVDPASLPLDLLGLRGLLDPREAWEALASRGLIPMDWVDAPARRFMASGMLVDRPPSLRMGVALAADVPGVLRAEAYAWEAVARAEPWGGPRPSRVVWSVAQTPRARSLPVPRVLDGLVMGDGEVSPTVRAARSAFAAALAAREDKAWPDAHQDARHLVSAAARWRALCAAGTRAVGAEVPWPPGVAGALLADLPDPFEPVLGVWVEGYLLAGSNPVALSLVAPDL